MCPFAGVRCGWLWHSPTHCPVTLPWNPLPLSRFGSIASLFQATQQELSLCPGLGPTKARRLHEAYVGVGAESPATQELSESNI